jgi:FkbH-like protein
MTSLEALKEEIAQLIERGPRNDGAYVRASDLLESADLRSLPELRLAILRSFTIEPLLEVLRVRCFLAGFRLELFLSEFNQYQQGIVNPSSEFYRFRPTVTFLAVRLEDLCPRLYGEFSLMRRDELESIRSDLLLTISGWVECINEQCATDILLSNFLVPSTGALGLYDTQTAFGQLFVIRFLNAEMMRLPEQFPNVHLFDLELLAGKIGKTVFCDPLQLYRASNPYRLSAYPPYGEWLMTHIMALLGRRRKCLVLDLDGTLWGGVAGEDGLNGVKLSDSYPGNCFKEFQRAILQLHDRGTILAVNSKNNYEDGIEMIRSHPDMILREQHFSAIRINWKDKVENLRDIACELNVGLDALVFIDDSPVECEQVRRACPEVLVVQLPKEPHTYRTLLDDLSCFDQLTVTPEDRARGELYRGRSCGRQLAEQSRSLEEFFASLDMRATLYRNERSHIPRIAQMTQKTNQFNLTTKRYTGGEIACFMEQAFVYSLRVEDKFGDNGIVAAAVVVPSADGEWCVDSFLMSCRVIMRTIEDTLISKIAEEAREMGVKLLVGLYIPSQKNQIVKDFYERRGFRVRTSDGSERVEYVFELTENASLRPSPWIRLTRAEERSGSGHPRHEERSGTQAKWRDN